MSPRRLFRVVAVTEACTWALLLVGMFLKYVTKTTEAVVSVGGMLHGIAFIAFLLTTIVVGQDQRWSFRRTITGLASAIPPFFTIWFDLATERRGLLGDTWRLASEPASGGLEKPVSWLVRKPLQGLAAGVVAVAVLTGLALVAGPPVG